MLSNSKISPVYTGDILSFRYQTLLLERTYCLGADTHTDLFTINNDGLYLKVWLPDLFGVALAKADIIAKLLALACKFTFLHN